MKNILNHCRPGDYVLDLNGDLHHIELVRENSWDCEVQPGCLLWKSIPSNQKEYFIEWDKDGEVFNSGGEASDITKLITLEKHPEYFL